MAVKEPEVARVESDKLEVAPPDGARTGRRSTAVGGRTESKRSATAPASDKGGSTIRSSPTESSTDPNDSRLRLDEATRAVERAMSALHQATEQLQKLLAGHLEQVSASAANAAPELERAAEIFKREVRALLGDDAPDDNAVRRAARQTLAEQAWERRLGTLIDTSDVVDLLGVSRQQVSALAKNHRLITLKHDGRHRFPAWQFAGTDPKQRACLAESHQRLVEVGALSPWAATTWFLSEHPELGDVDPVSYLRAEGSCDQLLAAAQRDAARAAQ